MDESTTDSPSQQIPADLSRILTALQGEQPVERRAEPRHPLFAPAALRSTKGSECHSAFSRELSASGIGLVLGKALERGDVYELSLEHSSQAVRKRVEVVWCRAVAEGWFLSGCRFVQ